MRLVPRFRSRLRRTALGLALLGALAPLLAGLVQAAAARADEAPPGWVMAALCGPPESDAGPAQPAAGHDAAHHHLLLCPLCPALSLAGPLLGASVPPLPMPVTAQRAAPCFGTRLPARDGPSPGAPPRGPPLPV